MNVSRNSWKSFIKVEVWGKGRRRSSEGEWNTTPQVTLFLCSWPRQASECGGGDYCRVAQSGEAVEGEGERCGGTNWSFLKLKYNRFGCLFFDEVNKDSFFFVHLKINSLFHCTTCHAPPGYLCQRLRPFPILWALCFMLRCSCLLVFLWQHSSVMPRVSGISYFSNFSFRTPQEAASSTCLIHPSVTCPSPRISSPQEPSPSR